MSFFINLGATIHTLTRQMLAESAPRNFCRDNTVMLTFFQVSNGPNFPLINYSVFCHHPQPYSALSVY